MIPWAFYCIGLWLGNSLGKQTENKLYQVLHSLLLIYKLYTRDLRRLRATLGDFRRLWATLGDFGRLWVPK